MTNRKSDTGLDERVQLGGMDNMSRIVARVKYIEHVVSAKAEPPRDEWFLFFHIESANIFAFGIGQRLTICCLDSGAFKLHDGVLVVVDPLTIDRSRNAFRLRVMGDGCNKTHMASICDGDPVLLVDAEWLTMDPPATPEEAMIGDTGHLFTPHEEIVRCAHDTKARFRIALAAHSLTPSIRGFLEPHEGFATLYGPNTRLGRDYRWYAVWEAVFVSDETSITCPFCLCGDSIEDQDTVCKVLVGVIANIKECSNRRPVKQEPS